jgi:hypothetical protein
MEIVLRFDAKKAEEMLKALGRVKFDLSSQDDNGVLDFLDERNTTLHNAHHERREKAFAHENLLPDEGSTPDYGISFHQFASAV